MNFLAFLLLGLLAGAIARAIMPDKVSGGWIISLLLGVIGAMVGGWIGNMVDPVHSTGFFSIWSWLTAIGGACLVLVVYGLVTGKRH